MLPLRDDIPARRYPVITLGLVVLNVVMFLYQLQQGRHLNLLLVHLAIIPVRYTDPEVWKFFSLPEQATPFLSSMFLHGGWLHLIGNMWVLWIFGDNVEDRLGRVNFLVFYLVAGIAAGLMHVFTNPNSTIPTIGASGAVAGVMGAYIRFFPHARVATLIPPFFLGPFFELPAFLFLGWWALIQLFNGTVGLLQGQTISGVAWWAHIGGFAYGLVVASLLASKRRRTRLLSDEFD